MNGNLYFDVSEVYFGSDGRVNHGIRRVVIELAVELMRAHPSTIFVTLPQSGSDIAIIEHKELIDTIEGKQSSLLARERSINFVFHKLKALGLARLGHLKSGKNSLREDAHGVLVSCSRPRFMRQFLRSKAGPFDQLSFVPLLHDFFPFRYIDGRRGEAFAAAFEKDTARAIAKAHMVLTNSRFTASELTHFSTSGRLPTLPPTIPIQLCHELREQSLGQNPDSSNRTLMPDAPYFLIIGASTGRKNIEVVLNAMMLLHHENNTPAKLVLSGRIRQRIKKFVALKKYEPIAEHITFFDSPSEQEIIQLYKSAQVLIMPSKLEGWGFPAAEALWFGTRVIAADTEIMREVCDKHALYFQPDDAAALKCLMAEMTSGSDQNNPQVERSELRAWSNVASDLLLTVEQLQKDNPELQPSNFSLQHDT